MARRLRVVIQSPAGLERPVFITAPTRDAFTIVAKGARPPQTIISLPVQTAGATRAVGALVVLVALQLSVPGSYLPPVPKNGVGLAVTVGVGVAVGVGCVVSNAAGYVP